MKKFEWKIKTRLTSTADKSDPNWLVSVLAKNRGLDSAKKLADFLNPDLSQILNVKLANLDKGIKRVEEAIRRNQKIIVYSDYDADGICATAIMWETLFDLGADVMPYVPHRIREGYGLASEAISNLAREGVSLIITVDHGVTAKEQIDHAQKLGVDVVVTDHHVLPNTLPKPYALVHSIELCGAGVAWRFCHELISRLKPNYGEKLEEKLELAALATIADLVPVLGGSRAMVKLGLHRLARTKRPGLLALIRSAGINGVVGTYEIGHILAPRINAMGRIEHGMDSLRLLCTKSQKQAGDLAHLLSSTNNRRQDLTVAAVEKALGMVGDKELIGVIDHVWHEGVIGLVASRLVETYHRPMVVISRGETYSKGSARSIPGFNMVEAIRASSEFLVDGGGHPMAAGFTIETRHIELFRQHLVRYAQTKITSEMLSPRLEIECELETSDINKKTLEAINQFEPFGMGNPQPLFLTRKMEVDEVRTVGAASGHLKLAANGVPAIGFGLGGWRAKLRPGYLVDLVYSISEDNFNGKNSLQLKIRDLRIS